MYYTTLGLPYPTLPYLTLATYVYNALYLSPLRFLLLLGGGEEASNRHSDDWNGSSLEDAKQE